MAGTLTVQNLQGPSSGANANKVIIPSGQTLDASGGTLVPSAGQVVQVKLNTHTSFDSTANAWTDVVTQTITPKYDNSLIIVRYTGQLYKYNTVSFPNSDSRITHDQGGAYSEIVKHYYITYHDTAAYMYSLSMSARFTVSNTNEYTIRMQIDPKTHRTYIYTDSNLLTIEEYKQ